MENNQPNKYLVPLAIVVAGVMVAGAIYYGGSGGSIAGARTQNNQKPTTAADITEVSSKDRILGDPNAPIVIVEYSDTECPFCKVFHNTMHQIVEDYDGQVAWVYRHFPIPQLHERATKEAEATECAYEQGGNTAFWKFLDEIFERTNSNDSLDPAELPKIAGEIGIDVAKFNTCLASGKYNEAVEASADDAVKSGARGTPYSVIIPKDGENVVINGAESLASVKAKIDALLK